MATQKTLISTFEGKAGGAFDGRTFVRTAGYQKGVRAELKEIGAEFKGSAYLLPAAGKDETAAVIAKLEGLAETDKAAAMRDRTPVKASEAEKLKVGDEFDFGGEVGEAKIAGIGTSYKASGETIHDPRIAEFAGEEIAFVYNANPPRQRVELTEEEKAEKKAAAAEKAREARAAREAAMTDEEKAERAAASAAAAVERDKMRMLVLAGSVKEGDEIAAGGETHSVSKLGREFEVDEKGIEGLKSRFPDAEGIEIGAKVQFAQWDAPEKEPETDGLGM